MKPIRTLALVVNANKPDTTAFAGRLTTLAAAAGITAHTHTAYPLPTGTLHGYDACCTLGGDGTLLGAVAECVAHGMPIFGINRGKLGFLTTFSEDDIQTCLQGLRQGQYQTTQRTLLECLTGQQQRALALNDIVIRNTAQSRLIALAVYANDELVTPYHADGLIFATPTGSTAYNLSAHGPIIHPDAKVLAMTPICPHTLSNRTLIFSETTPLRIHCENAPCELTVSVDGQATHTSPDAFPLQIRMAPETLTLVQPPDHSHFRLLRTKLHWGVK